MLGDALPDASVPAVTANRWRQGDIFPVTAHGRLQACIGKQIAEDHVCIAISHSCDLVRPDPSLAVEVVLGRPTGASLDGSVAYGRSRKRLQLLVAVDDAFQVFEICAGDRFDVPLDILADHAPDSARVLACPTQRDSLVEWLVARYARPGLPNAFERRIDRHRRHLERAAKNLRSVWRIYIGLTPWEELPADQAYDVELRFVMTSEEHGLVEKRHEALEAIEKLLEVLGRCDGLRVPADPQETIFSDEDMTLFDERHLRRWERFDYASFADARHVQDTGQI
ncbi:MAG: hypothetical protein HY778_11220 [Betaproteobacteria bacterium]|nr:hypothetical protein [Betaproteobacteria bacterium]